MKKILMLFLLTLQTSVVFADNCERPKNTFDSIYCAKKIFYELDESLNTTYAQLRKKLNKSEKKSLKKSQLAWIRHRNTTCTIASENAVIVPCAVKETRSRLTFLQNRLAECKSVGCIESRIQKRED